MFLLKTPNKNGSALIYATFNYHGNRFSMSADLTINPAEWDKKRERPKRNFKYYSQYAAILERIENAINEAYYEAILTVIPSKDALKAAVLAKLDRKPPMTVARFAAEYAEAKQGAYGTKLHFKNVAGKLADYNPKLTFDKIDLAVMLDFRDWLLKQGYESNTVAGWFKRFKTILNAAYEQGVTDKAKWRHSKATASGAETTAIFLNEAELEQIRLTILPDWLEKYRDLLLVMAYTGTRFLDTYKINKANFVEDAQFFRIVDQKENAVAQIPLHPIVLKIMDKYQWKLPRISNQKFNIYAKEVGRIAKIDQQVNVISFPGGIRKDQLKPKYELITSHTGRRSLITNLIIAGLNHTVIRSISGHKTEQAFSRYIKLAPADSLKIAYKNSFFAGKVKTI